MSLSSVACASRPALSCTLHLLILFAVPFLHGGMLCRIVVDVSVSPLIARFFESYFEMMVP